MKISRQMFAVGILSLAMSAGYTSYVVAATPGASQNQMQGVVHDYIINNPDVLVQSLQGYQQKQMDLARKSIEKTQQTSSKYADSLFHQNADPSVGNPNGEVTIVEFFDYQCPHCVDMTPIIENLLKTNSNLRIVLKEFPIRGPNSEFAAKAALAANLQGKYFDLHKGLMESKTQPLTQEVILNIAKTVGIDLDKLNNDMKGSVVADQLKANFKLAQDLQLMGTPAFFIAKSTVNKNSPASAVVFVPGQLDQGQLVDIINKIQK